MSIEEQILDEWFRLNKAIDFLFDYAGNGRRHITNAGFPMWEKLTNRGMDLIFLADKLHIHLPID